MTIIAVNKVYQSKVNRAIKWNDKYDALNRLREVADGDGDEKLERKLDKQCSNAYDNYLDIVYDLPKREQNNIDKFLAKQLLCS
jgi:hypothetical protein